MSKRLLIIMLILMITGACKSAPPNPITTQNTPLAATSAVPAVTDTFTPSPLPPTEAPIPNDTAPAPTEMAGPVTYGPGNFPENINPLTAQEINDPTILNRRPLSVKVQIFPRGQRPPMGIASADIVYDYYQNSGMTRFHAIFYGTDAEQVGPIRSGRLLDSHLVSMYNSILAFGSADSRILKRFYSSDFADRLVMEGHSNCPPMCRIDPNGFNYLVTNTHDLSVYANENKIDNNPQDLTGMYFHALPAQGGQPGLQISVRFSISAYTRWDYDSGSGRYLRFQDTQEAQAQEGEVLAAMTDRNTGEQVTASNVIVLFIPHKYAFGTRPGLNEIIDILLETASSGPALAFRDGLMYQIQWQRPNKNTILSLVFPDGTAYPLKPGNTWFEVVGQSSSTAPIADGSSWRIEFAIP